MDYAATIFAFLVSRRNNRLQSVSSCPGFRTYVGSSYDRVIDGDA
jgi:hypothetical protein